jgi:hypothetical protein
MCLDSIGKFGVSSSRCYHSHILGGIENEVIEKPQVIPRF